MFIIDEGSYLSHHGIKGQKWGVRRYQNYDGSLTDAGRKRRNYEVIQKGSSVRRITGYKKKVEKNPLGLYAFGKDSEQEYIQSAKWLPSVSSFRNGKFDTKKALVTQYEFIKDAKLLDGKQAVDAYMKQFGNRTIKDYVIDYGFGNLANKDTEDDIKASYEYNKNESFKSVYDRFKKADQSQRAMNWAHGFIHNDVNYIKDLSSDKRTNMNKFVDKYRKLKYDAIIDPEDFSGNYKEPILIINEDAVKETGSYKFRLK